MTQSSCTNQITASFVFFFILSAAKEKTVPSISEVNEQVAKKVEFQANQHCTAPTSKEEQIFKKKMESKAAAGQSEEREKNLPIRTKINAVTAQVPAQSVCDTRPNSRELISQSNREVRAVEFKQQVVEMEVNKREKAEAAQDPKRDNLAKLAAGAKSKQNGLMKGQVCALISSRKPADISKTQSRPTAEGVANGGPQLGAVRASVTPLALINPSPPVVKLESSDVKGDEVQAMEVR